MRLLVLPALWLAMALLAAAALSGRPAATQTLGSESWKRMAVEPGDAVTTRPFPPRAGRNRCVAIKNIAAAQLFGDRAIELTLKGGARYRMFLAQECPALSFYQGFYYRPQSAGQLCAGRDVIGARSGGECAIASILPVREVGKRRARRN
ncbi:hypothetical protein [Sandarakinorhabdus sp.]|uniref:hypothetical protein n=1 Tax=Sandarakinorhabdus sp. TaxID=1916663 RepID=UPI00286E72B7|nr:hypothetical protein [Sandarakinorhabdus sp.]